MADLPERLDPRQLRASDADRERVAEVLRTAAAEGRLDLDEVDERLHTVYSARTYADLEPVLHDLPAAGSTPLPLPLPDNQPSRPGEAPATGSATAVMSGFTRRGPWMVPRVFTGIAFWGGGTVDLREARMLHGEVTIRAFAIMGGITVIVPEDAEIHVTGTGIMGGFAHDASGPGRHGAPRIHITGLAWWGGVNIERRRRKRRTPDA
ncbi:DUF1707 domain-containing protein [Dactylosporangium sp. NPDC051541]|uniref:DUF1707 SHOCT-like domain-containing protein n=1 Tax=Dactylosporangium sp. NPDC051541 TaxID=3363977 RepID=UPI0037AA948A